MDALTIDHNVDRVTGIAVREALGGDAVFRDMVAGEAAASEGLALGGRLR
jgi:hypothetical protein